MFNQTNNLRLSINMKHKVFLGGTCNDSTWRNYLISRLRIDYFNPVVEDWTPECQQEEERQKNEECDIHLYVITPKIKGVFSIAEVIESAMTPGKLCLFCILPKEDGDNTLFTDEMTKSLLAVRNMVLKHGGKTFTNLTAVLQYLSDYQ